MDDLQRKSLAEIEQFCKELGLKPFKAKELFRFINQKFGTDLEQLSTMKQVERELLKSKFFISAITPAKIQQSQAVEKAAFQLADGKIIETVFMDNKENLKTICVSSQVGCPIGCQFCTTGQLGFTRNLTCTEILSQVYYFAKKFRISNIVFMGMGEPFLNYDNILKAGKILNHDLGLNIASRKIVYSTVGIIAGLEKFSQEKEQFRLAWSLASPFDSIREKLVPFKGLKPIAETIKTMKEYQAKTKRRITIEYVLLKGINDNQADIEALAHIAKSIDSYINLITYNPSPNSPFKAVNPNQAFQTLKKYRLVVTVRKSLGQEISAACGQLGTADCNQENSLLK